jgi:tetratricopeptide (TPR) repeat protein
MKKQIFKGTLMFAYLVVSLTSNAQKAKETDAVLEYRKSMESMAKGDFEAAKKATLRAKEHVDAAAAHDETKASQKTLYHKGEIYYNFLSLSMMSQDTVFAKQAGGDPFTEMIGAFKTGYAIKGKFNSDIKQSVLSKKIQLDGFTGMLYKNGNFKEAMELYDAQVQLSDVLNEVDTSSLFNSAVCAEKANDINEAAKRYKKCAEYGYKAPDIYAIASGFLRKAGQIEEAKAIISMGRKKFPSDRSLLLEMVNTNIDEGNSLAAEQGLQEAIAADPKNKQLYYVIGTIYIDLKQNDKAEAALNKAIELDPNYADAQYQLGAHLLGVASQLKEDASRLKFGDAQYDVLMAQSDENYKKALVPLESYITKQPNDKDVLTILFQIHKSLKNTEKALEYKKRADAIK